MRHAILPQAVRRVIPPLMNELVILIKDTSLVIVLGLTESQRELMSVAKVGFGDIFNATLYVATAIGYLCVSLPLSRLVNVVERRLCSGLVGVELLLVAELRLLRRLGPDCTDGVLRKSTGVSGHSGVT